MGPKRRSPVNSRLPQSRMTGLPAPSLWSAKLRLFRCHFPHPDSASSPMNRGRLHAGKEGSGTLGGKAGPSQVSTQLLVLVGCWDWLLVPSFTFCHHWLSSHLRSLFQGFSDSSLVYSSFLSFPYSLTHTLSTPGHSITTATKGLACGVSASTGGRWHVRTARRLLGHGREC